MSLINFNANVAGLPPPPLPVVRPGDSGSPSLQPEPASDVTQLLQAASTGDPKAAAKAMRCILIENARRKSRWKRGGRLERVELEGLELAADTPPDTLLVVHGALEKFAAGG